MINIIFEYSLIIVLGNISPKIKIIRAIGIKSILSDIVKLFILINLIKYTVKNEDANIFARFVPMRATVKNLGLFSIMNLVNVANLYFCLIHTSICNLFADIKAISVPENKIEKNSPVIAKFISNIVMIFTPKL